MIIYNYPISVGPVLDPITDIVFPDGYIKGLLNLTEYQDNNTQVHNVPQFQVNSDTMLLYGDDSINLTANNGFVTIEAKDLINIQTNLDNGILNIGGSAQETIINLSVPAELGVINILSNGIEGVINIYANGNNGFIEITSTGVNGYIYLNADQDIIIAANLGIRNKNYTTAEINALFGMQPGTLVFNTTLNTLCFYTGSNWKKVANSLM